MTDHPNPNRQFVACQFNPWDQRSYTYHNDGELVDIGDKVIVETTKGQRTVEVVALTQEPSFPTKAIFGLAPPEEAPEAIPQTETKEA